ncbi:MAG TPA: SRPBCC domain-containing protein [Gaiellaceae bacterium]|nr:SRPBCC domain-containing protein [Gaiellaceae bacterium]
MDATTESISVEREIAIAASPQTVWELLVDPESTMRWMGQSATFDLRSGGEYRVEVIPGHVASGEFVEIGPPRRLVHTFGWEGETGVPPGSSIIEYELIPSGDGTLLRFTHRDLPNAEAAESHAHGWDHYLERLTAVGTGGDPGPDPWISGPAA